MWGWYNIPFCALRRFSGVVGLWLFGFAVFLTSGYRLLVGL